ncbi:MAG TPA: gamma-glutamylcyclotransferase [Alphaproteobacteria bacterium]|nr:gamma-glutamylcyclotransferase [Alphaproteobacteria bacterium]USO04740.1 MAG: gamma-glutamylcyclotransferase [Rhodospirillales bacterium]HOO81251.1 gamma-glutamylcyclotransferase [Alphaproteobacteria bacterium]
MALLFLYGTLMRGFRNAAQLDLGHFLGPVRTAREECSMVACVDPPYPFPGVIAGHSHIAGELYDAGTDLLRRLDAFELEGQEYMRETIALNNGESAQYYRLIYPSRITVVDQHAQIDFNKSENCYRWVHVE